jgi:hypothetical protein
MGHGRWLLVAGRWMMVDVVGCGSLVGVGVKYLFQISNFNFKTLKYLLHWNEPKNFFSHKSTFSQSTNPHIHKTCGLVKN